MKKWSFPLLKHRAQQHEDGQEKTAPPNPHETDESAHVYATRSSSRVEEKIIGIDLGTSNSAAAAMVGGKPTIVPAAEGVSIGGKAVPSYVAFTEDGQVLVGEPARRA